MASNINKEIIQIIVRGGKKAKTELKGVSGGLASMAKRAALAAGAFFGARGLIRGFKELSEQGSKLRTVGQAFDNMGKKIDFTSLSLSKLQKATNGTISEIDLMTKANNAMALSIVNSDDEMAELFDTAQRLGEALGVDTARALDSLVTGMGRQSKLMLDNLGIMVDANVAYETYAEQIGKSANELDDLEKKTAFNNEVMRQARDIVNSMGAEQETAQRKMQRLRATFSDMTADLGNALTPELNKLTETFTVAADAVGEFLLKQTEDDTETAIRNLKKLGVDTKELEMSLLNLEKSKAMSALGESFFTVGTNMDKVKGLQQDISTLTEQETERQKHRLTIEQQILDLTKNGTDLQTERNNVSSEGFPLGDIALQQELEKLEIQRDSFIEDQANFEAKVQAIQDEIALRQKLQKLIIDTGVAETKNTDSKVKKEKLWNKLQKEESRDVALQEINAAGASAKANLIKQIMKAMPFPLNLLLAKGAGDKVDSLFSKLNVKFAQYGADFVTDGPQMMMVGEQNQREHVQVTPLEGPNLEGPQGQGLTVNVSGNVMTDDFIESTLAEKIRESIRLGENLGV